MKILSIVIILVIIILIATFNVDASGVTVFYQNGASKALNIILYFACLISLVALKRKILK